MTSVTNSSGLNYQNGINPLGRKVRALEAEVIDLRKELTALKSGGVSVSSTANASPTLNADIEALKKEIATIKAAGYGKGEKGDKGDKGDRGEKGEPGPMTYIAMPAGAALPTPTTTA